MTRWWERRKALKQARVRTAGPCPEGGEHMWVTSVDKAVLCGRCGTPNVWSADEKQKAQDRIFGDVFGVVVGSLASSVALGLWAYDGNPVALFFASALGWCTLVGVVRWHRDLGR